MGELRVSERRAVGLQARNGPAFGLHGGRETSFLHLIIFKEFLDLHINYRHISYIQFQQSIKSDACELSDDGLDTREPCTISATIFAYFQLEATLKKYHT